MILGLATTHSTPQLAIIGSAGIVLQDKTKSSWPGSSGLVDLPRVALAFCREECYNFIKYQQGENGASNLH